MFTPPISQTIARASALSLVAIALALFLSPITPAEAGLAPSSPWFTHLTYSLIHVSAIHLALNAYALLYVVFLFHISPARLAGALLIASAYPKEITPIDCPTVGLSAIIFALLASLSWDIHNGLYFQAVNISNLIIGFFVPGMDPYVHIFAYILGLGLGALVK